MKKLTTIAAAILLLAGGTTHAQTLSPRLYGTLSTGLENPYGAVGGNLELCLAGKVSVAAGAGISLWGMKYAGEAKYYFNNSGRGWAIGAGISHSRGMSGYDIEVEDAAGKRSVDMILKPVSNVYGAVYRYWKLGKGNNRFHLQAGYSARLSDTYYTFNETYIPTKSEQSFLRSMSPGGLMFAAGFSFALSK